MPKEISLHEKQVLLPIFLAQLVLYAKAKGWGLTLGDGSIDPIRVGIPFPETGPRQWTHFRDLVHMEDGLHYLRLAQDYNLFVKDYWITRDSPEWRELGTLWKGFHPLCRWGGDFKEVDLDHFSITHNGKE